MFLMSSLMTCSSFVWITIYIYAHVNTTTRTVSPQVIRVISVPCKPKTIQTYVANLEVEMAESALAIGTNKDNTVIIIQP